MPSFDPKIDAAFREYADLELRCHFLLLEGKEDDPEITAAEDRMSVLWEKLDEVQRRSLNGMGSDLNWVRRKGEPPPKGRKTTAEVPLADEQELAAALRAKDWHKALHYLRLCAPTVVPRTLAALRGSTYEALGFPTYANVFYDQAAEFDRATDDIGMAAHTPQK